MDCNILPQKWSIVVYCKCKSKPRPSPLLFKPESNNRSHTACCVVRKASVATPPATKSPMKSIRPVITHRKLNSRLWPILVGLLLVAQLIVPYQGWFMLLVGLGGSWLIAYRWAIALERGLMLERERRFGWAQVGDNIEERFTLINDSFWPALWVEVTDHSTMPDYLSSRVTGVGGWSRNRWQVQGRCQQRGVFTIGPTSVYAGDPFGLYMVELFYPTTTALTVTPAVLPLPAITVAAGGHNEGGRARSSPWERTVSVSNIRAYTPGDNLNSIHWKTSARRNKLYVRQFESMPSGDWWVFLDLAAQAQMGQGYNSTEEHGVMLAASLADKGLRLGQAVGLVAQGQELVWLSPYGGDTQRQKILQALALVKPGEHSLAELLYRARPAFGRLASLIIITADLEGAWVEAVLPLLRRGAVPTVLLFEPHSFGSTAEAAPIQAMLTHLGITCHLIPRELLDRPEARPGHEGEWEWRITPSGRAIPRHQPRDQTWKRLY